MDAKEQVTTRQAFESLIGTRAWYNDAGITQGTALSLMTRYRQGKITIDKMEEVLEKAGYKVVQEKLWSK